MGGGALLDFKGRTVRLTGNERQDRAYRRQVEVLCPICGEPKWVDHNSLANTGYGGQHKKCANMSNGLRRSAESRVIRDNFRKYYVGISKKLKSYRCLVKKIQFRCDMLLAANYIQ